MARDGFIIETYSGREVNFIACAKDGRMRDKVERGLELRINFERYTFRDTRWNPSSSGVSDSTERDVSNQKDAI